MHIKLITSLLIILNIGYSKEGHSKEVEIKNPKKYTRLMTIENNTLRFMGSIGRSNIDKIIKIISDNPQIKSLAITSGGGEVSSNIRLAYLIKDKGIAINVIDYCISSCFNYLFLAAKNKSIQPHSFLGFHGTATTSIPFVARVMPELRKAVREEKTFIKALGLDKNIFKKLHKKANKIDKKSDIEADFFIVGEAFFNQNKIILDSPWFPKSQEELNDLVFKINEKIIERRKEPHEPWKAIGDFG